MFAERAARIAAEAPALTGIGDLLGDQCDGAVEPDVEHVITGFEAGVGFLVLHVGAETADAGRDRLTGLGIFADFARQRKQLERLVEIDVFEGPALGYAGPLRLLLFGAFAELKIRSKPA